MSPSHTYDLCYGPGVAKTWLVVAVMASLRRATEDPRKAQPSPPPLIQPQQPTPKPTQTQLTTPATQSTGILFSQTAVHRAIMGRPSV